MLSNARTIVNNAILVFLIAGGLSVLKNKLSVVFCG